MFVYIYMYVCGYDVVCSLCCGSPVVGLCVCASVYVCVCLCYVCTRQLACLYTYVLSFFLVVVVVVV